MAAESDFTKQVADRMENLIDLARKEGRWLALRDVIKLVADLREPRVSTYARNRIVRELKEMQKAIEP